MTAGRAWSLLAFGDDRQYAGNTGYSDVVFNTYTYDSAVANHRNLAAGDLVFLRDRTKLLGIALVESIVEQAGQKIRFRCPQCARVDLKERQTVQPKWRCGAGHTFSVPTKETAAVTIYEAKYSTTYIPTPATLTASQIKAAALRPSDQLSIEQINPDLVEGSLVELVPKTRVLFARFAQRRVPEIDDGADETPESEGEYTPQDADTRDKVLRAIRARRGQSRFRKALMKRYGAKCVISGCGLTDILEAAHIWPYRGKDDNHPSNGLLMRTDLHTLFDLNLLAIDPANLKVHLHPDVASAPSYSEFNGQLLAASESSKPSHQALSARWTTFRDTLRIRGGHALPS